MLIFNKISCGEVDFVIFKTISNYLWNGTFFNSVVKFEEGEPANYWKPKVTAQMTQEKLNDLV